MCCGGTEETEPDRDQEDGLFRNVQREEMSLGGFNFIPGHYSPFGPNSPQPRTKKIRRLFSKTGFLLALFPNGKVRGVKSPRNKYGLLEFESAGLDGELRIKGKMTGFYVTMTPKGRVVAQPLRDLSGTVWIETRIQTGGSYFSLLNRDYAHLGHYLGIKKSGKPKGGEKTTVPYPQAAISFLATVVED